MPREGGAFRVLMVEDDLGDAGLIRISLMRSGFDVDITHAKNGDDALARLGQVDTFTWPDLILLDLSLPGISGHEILAQIKQSPKWRKIPVVVLSTSDAPADVDRAYDLGANSFLTKAMDMADFQALLNTTLRFWFGVAQLPVRHSNA